MRILFVVVWPITTNSGETKYKKQQRFQLLLFYLARIFIPGFIVYFSTRDLLAMSVRINSTNASTGIVSVSF